MNTITLAGVTVERITSFDPSRFLGKDLLKKKIVDGYGSVETSFPLLPNEAGLGISQMEDGTKFSYIVGSLEYIGEDEDSPLYGLRVQSYETRDVEAYREMKEKEEARNNLPVFDSELPVFEKE